MRGEKKDNRNYFITAVIYILNVFIRVDCFHTFVNLFFLHLSVYLAWNFLIHGGYWLYHSSLGPDASAL